MDMYDLSWILPLRTDALTQFFSIFKFFASDKFYIILISLGYWSLNSKIFKNCAFLVCISTMLNCLLKVFFHIPRPAIEHLVTVHDPFGFPSGDVQVVATLWIALAWYFKNPILWVFSFLMIMLVAMSRVYLGVHYPLDVMVGAIVGIGFFIFYNLVQSYGFWKIINKNELLLFMLFFIFLGTYLAGMNSSLNMMSIAASGLLLGIFLGLHLSGSINYEASGSWYMRVFIGLFGLLTMIVLRSGLFSIWHKSSLTYAFMVYATLGLYIMYVVPFFSRKVFKISLPV